MMTRFLRFIVGFLYYIQQHFSFRSLLREGKFLLLNLSNADQANQDVRHLLAQMAPGLELVHYSIGSIELNSKLQATGKYIVNNLVSWFGSKKKVFSNQGLELVMSDVQLLVRRQSPLSSLQSESSAYKIQASASLSTIKNEENGGSQQQQQKPQDWMFWLGKVPEIVKQIEVRKLHVCYEDESDTSKPLLAGFAFENLLFNGENRSIDLNSLMMHLSPPISQQKQHDEIKAVMSEIFTDHSLKFHPVLQPLSISVSISLTETDSWPRAVMEISIRGFNVDMTRRQYELLTGQVDRLNRLFRQDVKAATRNARGADLMVINGSNFEATESSDSAAVSVEQFNAKVSVCADEIRFALRDGRTPIVNVQLNKLETCLKRVSAKCSLTASLGSLSAHGYDGRELVATQACQCRQSELGPNQTVEAKFVKLHKQNGAPCSLDIGTCRVVHCVSTAAHLSNFFQVSELPGTADDGQDAEPELDEDLLKTLRFLTRRGAGRRNGGASRSVGQAADDEPRFRGHLDGLSFRLPAGPLETEHQVELICQLEAVDLVWLKSRPAHANVIDRHLKQLCLTTETAPKSVHQLTLRLKIFANSQSDSKLNENPIVETSVVCGFGVNAPMDLPKMSLVFKLEKTVQLCLSPASLATVAGAAKWSGPSLSRLLGIPSSLPKFAEGNEENQNRIESPLKWQTYVSINLLTVTMETTNLRAHILKIRLNAVKQPNWLEARLFVDQLVLEDQAYPKPVGLGSPASHGRLHLLSTQLDAVESADSGEVFQTQGSRARLVRVPYKIPDEDFQFLSLSALMSPERMSAEGEIDALVVCLQPDCLAGCLRLVEDLCRRFADLPLPPAPPAAVRADPPQPQDQLSGHASPISLKLLLTNARLDLATAEHKLLCICRLTQLYIDALSNYDIVNGESRQKKRELRLRCTGLEVDANRSCSVPSHRRRQLYAKPLLADSPDGDVASLRVSSWPGPVGASRLEIDFTLSKVQLVLLPELLDGLRKFSESVQVPLMELQSRLNWQAGDVLESAETELRKAGGLKVRADIFAPRLILPLGGDGNRALCIDLGELTLESSNEAIQFQQFVSNQSELRNLQLKTPTSGGDADELRLRFDGLSASVDRLVSGPRTGSLRVARDYKDDDDGDDKGGNILRFFGVSETKESPVLNARLARLRCAPSVDSVEQSNSCHEAWLAVAMETAGFRIVFKPKDLLPICSCFAAVPGNLAPTREFGDAVDGRLTRTRAWLYDCSIRGGSLGLMLLRQGRTSSVWQISLAAATVEALADGDCRADSMDPAGDSGRNAGAPRWSIFDRTRSNLDPNSGPADHLLLIRSVPRSLTVNLAACQLCLWPDELPLINDCLAALTDKSGWHDNQRLSRMVEPSSIAVSATNSVDQQRSSQTLTANFSVFRVQLYEQPRSKLNCSNHSNQSAELNNNSFVLSLGSFIGTPSEAELTNLRLTFRSSGRRLTDSRANDVELLMSNFIHLSLPSRALSFESLLTIRITTAALSSAVVIGNMWQSLLTQLLSSSGAANGTASESESAMLTTKTVSLTVRDSFTGALLLNVDKLSADIQSTACRLVLVGLSANVSLQDNSREPFMKLDTPSVPFAEEAIAPSIELLLNWPAGFSNIDLNLTCPSHRICLAVSPASIDSIARLVEKLRLTVAGSADTSGNVDSAELMNVNGAESVYVTDSGIENNRSDAGNGNHQNNRAGSDARNTGSDARNTGSDTRNARSDARNTGSDVRNTGGDARNTGSDARNTGSDIRSTGSDTRNARSDARNTGSDARNTGSDTRNTGSDARNTGSGVRNTGSDARNAGSDAKNAGRDAGNGNRYNNRTESCLSDLNHTGSRISNGTGSAGAAATAAASEVPLRFRVNLHSVSILFRTDAATTTATSSSPAACQRCPANVACRTVANLSFESVGPVWLKCRHPPSQRNPRLRLLKPNDAAVLERLHRSWQALPTLSKSSAVELADGGNLRVKFEPAADGNVLMTMIQPKLRRLVRRHLPGFVGDVQLTMRRDGGGRAQFDIRLGRLQLDQCCPSALESLRVPLSVKARQKADLLAEGRLLGAEISVCLSTAAPDEPAADGDEASAQQQQQPPPPPPPPLHFTDVSLSLGRVDLAYDSAFVGRLQSILTPQSDAPTRPIRVDRLRLLRDLRLSAVNVPLGSRGWGFRVTVPADEARRIRWPDGDGDDVGDDAQRWAMNNLRRWVKHRPILAVTLPLGCLLGTCFRRHEFLPMELSTWASETPDETSPSPFDAVDAALAPAAELLERVGRRSPDERCVAADFKSNLQSVLLLTNIRLLELPHSLDNFGHPVATSAVVSRQFSLQTEVDSVEISTSGFRLLPCGETFTASPQFTQALMELALPGHVTPL